MRGGQVERIATAKESLSAAGPELGPSLYRLYLAEIAAGEVRANQVAKILDEITIDTSEEGGG